MAAAALGSRTGRSGGIVLSGPAGVGKTRLARELVARLSRAGTPAPWALATQSSRDVPLAAFGALVAGVDSSSPSALADAVGAVGDGRPVIGVDDAHLLDPLSALLVHRLVTDGLATVVVTVRDGETVSDAITSLWKDEHVPRIEVGPLSAEATVELLETVLEGPFDSDAARRLFSLTQGNALFLRHLVDGELTAGRLEQRQGVWCWPGAPAISGELAEIVGTQMGQLPAEVRDVVDVLALAEPLSVGAVESLADGAALEAAEERGLVVVEDAGAAPQARLTHPMYGEVRRAALGVTRARRLRGRIATTLAETGSREPVRRAVLTMESDLPPDPELFLVSAEHALVGHDVALGERLARAAADASGDFDARVALAAALVYAPRPDDAEELLAELVEDAPDDARRVQAGVLRIGNLYWVLRRRADGRAVLDDLLRRTSEPGPRDQLVGLGAALAASSGRGEEAVEAGARLLAEGRLTEVSAVMAAVAVLMIAGGRGQLDRVEKAVAEGHAASRTSAVTFGPRFGLADWGTQALRLAGRVPDMQLVAARVAEDVRDVMGEAQTLLGYLEGHVALAAGRIGTALRRLREAYAKLPMTHPIGERNLLYLTQATAMSGDAATARELLGELERVGTLYACTEPERDLVRAWISAAEGAVSEAVAVATRAARFARGQGAPAYEVLSLQTATQLGDPSGADRLAELVGVVQGPRAAAALAHARALADQDGEALARASETWEAIGDLVAATDAAAQAALAFRTAGQNGSGLAAAQRAQQLAQGPCEGLTTPAVRAGARPLPLTDREREIVTLAASGLTNRQIAERLTVSVRTVEGHLYRAGAKLGVHDRSELASVLAGE